MKSPDDHHTKIIRIVKLSIMIIFKIKLLPLIVIYRFVAIILNKNLAASKK